MGKRSSAHVPVRSCISCGSKRSKVDLLRLALDEEGCVVRDEQGVRPGRGAYVCRETDCMEQLPKFRLDRAFRRKFITRQPVRRESNGVLDS